MTTARVIRYADLEAKPWRNDLGMTRTIQSVQDGAGWALSIATIERQAEFSVIPDTQRVQLAIEPVQLVIDGDEVGLGHGEQVRFSGEQRVKGASTAASSRVLNLIYPVGARKLELTAVRSSGELPKATMAAVVLSGSLDAAGSILGPLDTVLLPAGADVQGFTGMGLLAVVHEVG